jgi:hypothetical protein
MKQAEATIRLMQDGKGSEFWKILSDALEKEKQCIEKLANPYETNKAPVDLARIQEIIMLLEKPDAIIKHAMETKERCLKKLGMAEGEEE